MLPFRLIRGSRKPTATIHSGSADVFDSDDTFHPAYVGTPPPLTELNAAPGKFSSVNDEPVELNTMPIRLASVAFPAVANPDGTRK